MNDYIVLACVAIGGILVGWVACCLFSWPYLKEGDKVIKAQQKLLDEKDELIEDKRDMIQVLDERISLGNEHISTLNDLLQAKDYEKHDLEESNKAAHDKIAELEKALR